MKKSIYSLIIISIMFFGFALIRTYSENYAPVADVNEDENSIKQVVSTVLHSAKNNSMLFPINFIYSEVDTTLEPEFETFPIYFDIINIGIKFSDKTSAEVTIDIFDKVESTDRMETMSFVKEDNQWKIASSTFLLQLLNRQLNSSSFREIFSSGYFAHYSVNQLVFSNTSLIKRTAFWTGDIYTLNETVTQNELNVDLFFELEKCGLVKLNSGDNILVASDKFWHRVVYANKEKNTIKSYGDIAGTGELQWPSKTIVDKFGNIYLLSKIPQVIQKLKYNQSTNDISNLGSIALNTNGTIKDIALDVNNTVDDPTDDYFWIVNRYTNEITKINMNGQNLGSYTSIENPYTSLRMDIKNPIAIIKPIHDAFNFKLAFIDVYGKRLVVLNDILGFTNGTIQATFTATDFGNMQDVEMSSIGFISSAYDGIWAADKKNGCFHIFPYQGGYSCTVKSIDGLGDQWTNPKYLISTAMSNNNISYLDFITIDNWNTSTGINTYLPGAEVFIGERKEYDFLHGPGVQYIYNIPVKTKIKTEILKFDNTFIKVMEDIQYNVGKLNGPLISTLDVSAIGKYKIKVTLLPAYNNYYPQQWAMAPIYKYINFALPITGSISGPDYSSPGNQLNFEINITSGSGMFGIVWYKKVNNEWVYVDDNPAINLIMGTSQLNLKCEITDNYNQKKRSIYKSIGL